MKKLAFLFLLSLTLFLACGSESGGGDDPVDNFDRKAMLTNWADAVVVPGLTAFSEATESLSLAATAFAADPTTTTLTALRTEWETAYLLWQRVSMFTSPTSELLRYRDQMNIYPLDAEKLEGNIAETGWNLELPSNNDVQGFPAMDYLLYGVRQNDADLIDLYASSVGTAYRQYLTDVSKRMNELTKAVLADWTGDYRTEFINNSGNTATASVDRFVNDYVFYYEKHLRAGKVGIPAGVFSGSPLSNKVEAYYRGNLNKALLLEALNATQGFFNGQSFDGNTTGASLAQYLDYLNTVKNGADLSEAINGQFDAARDQINMLGDNFATIVETDNGQLLSTYDKLQRNVVLLKVDMLQAMNINVDYVDADGD